MSGGKLPEGWVTTHLSEICSKPQYGYTTKSSFMGDVKFLRTTDITKGAVDWSSVPYCMDAPEDVSKYQLQDRDIVISRAGSVGFSFLVQNPPSQVVFASYLIRFKPVNYFSEYYLKRFLESSDYWNQLSLMSAGNAVQNVNAQKLSTLTVPIPPIAEQKIIAEKLDTLLAQVDSTKARLEQIPQILKRFRQAVLTAAVNGLLTEAWRNKVQEPLNLKKINFELILAELRNGLSSKPNEKGLGHPILRISSVRSGHVDQSDIRYLECSEAELERHKLEEGDLLFTRYNGSLEFVGVCGLLKKTQYKDLLYPDKLIRARLTKDALPEYIEIFFSSPAARNAMMECVKTTSGQKGISGKDIKSQLVSLPSLKEQAEIVRRVEQLFAWADTIEKQVNSALTRVSSLTQSILAKAFRGELTAQWRAENPSLISGENSAAALLEKIKAERTASGGKKNSRKKV
ncbi:restriction endonuclease subunit S [Salmonella enterica subsp. enterica serovar Bonariensis]|nr:type I restriction-modification system specificity subunit [Salmonella enterica subsp. enterica serovar Bonariensis]EAO5617288.1 type I restriction-modification system specificity subunit [Salmonella enterica]ECE0374448.1 type I restriction-modification system specificity subunit [Salmonella enterica subsp. enterica]EDT7939127.1 type I restriction-modification system specificity subunit [Salmonella enterica subsp. enterica serovar Aba]EAB9990899.1 type I restriction-modification system speci